MIPKVIHYCWFGGNPIPAELQRCIDSWSRVMPEYEIKRWDESNYDVTKCDYMKEAYESKQWAFVSDYARIDICYAYGGIYLDVDVEVVKPFDDLLLLDGFCGFEISNRQIAEKSNLGLALGLALGLEMGKILRDDYHKRHFIKPDGTLDFTPCPIIQTDLLLKYGLQLTTDIQTINGLTVFPPEYFCPMNQVTGEIKITPNTYSIHHYVASWLPPADKERRELRRKYSQNHGKFISNVMSTFVAYRKYYGMLGMLKKIAGRFTSDK